jgi:hypothetical protein
MTNDKKQTAVEWLFQQTLGITLQLSQWRISHRTWELEMVKISNQANAMFEEQIINANEDVSTKDGEGWNGEYGIKDFMDPSEEIGSKEYFNETYKKQ